MTSFTITLFGAGKIGEAITAILSGSGRYTIRVCDADLKRAHVVANAWRNATAHGLDLSNDQATSVLLSGSHAVISALPFSGNVRVAELARDAEVHYFDLTEDIATSHTIYQLAHGASTCFMPQCGLAPGFISIAASTLIERFTVVCSVKLRVGALPMFPCNRLKYSLTWSTEGLINEYGNLCEAIVEGEKRIVLPLEGYEQFVLDGVGYEAFNTSGGLGTLCETYAGKVRSLDYKTIRYPGHRDLMMFLMNDLGFNHDRDTLRRVLERSLPATLQDKCIAFVEVIGERNGRIEQESYAHTVYHSSIEGHQFGAIQLSTAAGVCVPVDLVLTGEIGGGGGFLRNEMIDLRRFVEHEFGAVYQPA